MKYALSSLYKHEYLKYKEANQKVVWFCNNQYTITFDETSKTEIH